MKINSSISKIWFIIFTDVIGAKNTTSTSSPVKSVIFQVNKQSSVKNKFIRTDKPSCSSTNYVANIESSKTQLLVYIDSTIRKAKVKSIIYYI